MARAILVLPLLLASCTFVSGNSNVMVTSDPAGAEILVNGVPTGHTTPRMLNLEDSGETPRITLRKRGYEDESRTVYHYTVGYTSRWDDGAVDSTLINSPFWWTTGDFLTPFAVRFVFIPHDLMIRLYKEGEAPVTASDRPDPLTGSAGTPRQ